VAPSAFIISVVIISLPRFDAKGECKNAVTYFGLFIIVRVRSHYLGLPTKHNSQVFDLVTGQLAVVADKPTRGQSSHGLVNSQTSKLADMFDL